MLNYIESPAGFSLRECDREKAYLRKEDGWTLAQVETVVEIGNEPVEELGQGLAAAAKEISDYEDDVDDLENQVSSLERDVSRLEERVRELEGEVEESRASKETAGK